MGILSYMQNDTDTDKSSVVTVLPGPVIPCYFCDSEENGIVRFLNAAAGYEPFFISINNQMAVYGLNNGELSQYGRVVYGLQEVTVAEQNGYVYIKKQINVPLNGAVTVAVINTDSGPDLMEIADMICNGGINTGCFRVCNLSMTNPRVNISLDDGIVTFLNVNYTEVTSFQYLTTGYYKAVVSDSSAYTGNILITTNIYVRGNVSYTLYVFNYSNALNAIRILIVEDRRK